MPVSVNEGMFNIIRTPIKVGVRMYAAYTNCPTLTTQSCRLLRKNKEGQILAKTKLKFVKKDSMQSSVKSRSWIFDKSLE